MLTTCEEHVLLTLAVAGPDNLVDSARLTVLCSIPTMIHCDGDVPIQAVMYALCGHTGSADFRCSTEDPAWDLRNGAYDTIMPDDIREKARLERVRTKDDLTQNVVRKALSIVAMNDAVVLKRMSNQLSKQRAARQSKHARFMEGSVSDGSEGDAVAEDGAVDAEDCAVHAMDNSAPTASPVYSDSEDDDMYARMGM